MEAYSDEIDLREYIEVLWRWRTLIVAVTLIATAVAGVISFFVLEPVYEASVQIMVPQTPLPAEVIKSPHFMQTIIEEVGLHDKHDAFTLARAVSLETSKASTTLTTIRVQDGDPALAAKIANQIAQDFLEFVKSKNVESVSGSISYLTQEKIRTEAELESVRKELADLKQSTRIEALQVEVNRLAGLVTSYRSQEASSEIREQELVKGIKELEEALASTPKVLPGPPDWSGKPTEVPNETYLALEQTLTLKKVELAEVQVRLSEIREALPGVASDYDALYTKLLDFQRQVQELEAQESILVEQVASFTEKINQLTVNLPQTNLVSPAVEPVEPVKPHKLMNMLVAAVLGGFVSVLMVFGIEYWRSPRKTGALAQ